MENRFCTRCGAPLRTNAKFCTRCGCAVIRIAEEIKMPPVETASWPLTLGIFFGAFIILSVICFVI